MPAPEQVQAAVDADGAAYAARDREAFLALFSTDAVQIDPVPAPANVGHEAIGAFFDNAMGMAPDLALTVDRTIVCGDQAAGGLREVGRIVNRCSHQPRTILEPARNYPLATGYALRLTVRQPPRLAMLDAVHG